MQPPQISIRCSSGPQNTVASVGQLSTHLDGVVEDNREDIRAALRNFRVATLNVNKLMDQLNQIAAENRRPIRQFTEGSLPDLSALIIDARITVNKATAVLDSLQRNPVRFIFGDKMKEGVPAQMTRGGGGCPAGQPPAHFCRPGRGVSRPGRDRLRVGRRAAGAPVHPCTGAEFPAGASPRQMVARRRRAHRRASARHLANCADERPVSGRILRRGRMDRQRPGDGTAFADPVVPEYRPPSGSRVVAPDFRDGFLAAVKPAENSRSRKMLRGRRKRPSCSRRLCCACRAEHPSQPRVSRRQLRSVPYSSRSGHGSL